MKALLRLVLLKLLAWCSPEARPREAGVRILSDAVVGDSTVSFNMSVPVDYLERINPGDVLGVFRDGKRIVKGKFVVNAIRNRWGAGECVLDLSGDWEAVGACLAGSLLKVVR